MNHRGELPVVTIRAPRPLQGELRPPASKSIALRALVLASLARGTTRIAGLGVPRDRPLDVCAAVALLRQLGRETTVQFPGTLAVAGVPPGPHGGWRPRTTLEVDESGALARFATACAGLAGDATSAITIAGRGTLARRRSPALFAALANAGVGLEFLGEANAWPVRVTPIGPPPWMVLERPSSSQELSALVLALAAWPGRTALAVRGRVPSVPYFDLTRALAERFGASVAGELGSEGGELEVGGPLAPPAEPLVIEADASAAAVALAAAVASGGDVRVLGIGRHSLQGDRACVDVLRAFGAEAGADDEGLWARGALTRGTELDLAAAPDLAPVASALAILAALRHGETSVLSGLAALAGKESDRLAGLAELARAAGARAETGDGSLHIAPGAAAPAPRITVDPRGDHRMAFAAAILGCGGIEVAVRDPDCAGKSWPRFWDELARLGAELRVLEP